MKTIYIVYADEHGETEGLFDSDFNLVDFWWCNDASWRSEYFAGVLRYLGAEEGDATPMQEELMVAKLNAATKELSGEDDYEEEVEE